MYKGVIFDLDGTLLDSVEDIADSMNAVLQERDLPPESIDTYKQVIGHGLRELCTDILPREFAGDHTRLDEFIKDVRTIYAHRLNKKSEPYPGIPDLLRELNHRNIKVGVLSNKPHHLTLQVVEWYFSKYALRPCHGAREGIRRKPDPGVALDIARHMHLSPGKILFVGDTEVDMRTADAAGMTPIGVSWGFRESNILKQGGANYVIDQPRELLDLLD